MTFVSGLQKFPKSPINSVRLRSNYFGSFYYCGCCYEDSIHSFGIFCFHIFFIYSPIKQVFRTSENTTRSVFFLLHCQHLQDPCIQFVSEFWHEPSFNRLCLRLVQFLCGNFLTVKFSLLLIMARLTVFEKKIRVKTELAPCPQNLSVFKRESASSLWLGLLFKNSNQRDRKKITASKRLQKKLNCLRFTNAHLQTSPRTNLQIPMNAKLGIRNR